MQTKPYSRLQRPFGQVTLLLIFTWFLGNTRMRAQEWQALTPFNTTSNLYSVAIGGGMVAAGGDGILIYSPDNGTSWQLAANLGSFKVEALAHGNDRFVAVGLG